MVDPPPDPRPALPDSVSAASRAAAVADREAERLAEEVALRHRRSLAGRVERVARWLRDPRSGPVPRARRMGRVVVEVARAPRSLPALPRALLEAAHVPPIGAGLPPPRPSRDLAPLRQAARARLAAFDLVAATAGEQLRVALIADDPLAARFAASCEVLAVRPEDWRAALAPSPPDLLVVGSAWYGGAGAWQYRVAWYAHPDALRLPEMRALLAWCAEAGVPSVFWDTAGATAVPRFGPCARLCDLVVAEDPGAADAYAALADRQGAGVEDAGSAVGGPVADRLRSGLAPAQTGAA